MFAPSAATSQERAYVALSRGRHSNRIYATHDSGWQDAIATSRGHVFASDQQPDLADVRARLLRNHQRDTARPRDPGHRCEQGAERGRTDDLGRAIGM